MFSVKYGKPSKIRTEGVTEVAYISFKYSKEIVEFIKTLQPHFWHPEEKVWEISKEGLKALEKEYGGEVAGIKEEDKFWKETVKDYLEEVEIPKAYKYKKKPLPYQETFIKKALSVDNIINGSDTGTGKTCMAINVACIRKQLGQINKCLIICGKAILKPNWKKEEIPKHSKEKGHILGQRICIRGKNKGKIKKNEDIKAKIEDLENIDDIKEFFLITNVETLRNVAFTEKLKELCEDGTIGMIILDECTACKNGESGQGAALLELNPKYKMPMSGTLMGNNNMDFYPILKWIGMYDKDIEEYKKHFCIEKIIKKEFPDRWRKGKKYVKELPVIIGNKNILELREKLKHCMVRYLKKDVLNDLPAISFKNEYIEMTPEEWEIYDIVRSELKEKKAELLLKCNEQNELMRLRQVTGNALMVDNKKIKECSKINRTIELTKDILEANEKVIIFSYFTQITSVLKEKLKEYNPAYVTGEIQSAEARQEEIDRFKNDEKCGIMIASLGALGMGVTLTCANNVIFFDEGKFDPVDKKQAMDRVFRIGQEKKCLITTLMCANTIDEKVHKILVEKSQISDAILDNGEKVLQASNEGIDEAEDAEVKKAVGSREGLLDYILGD